MAGMLCFELRVVRSGNGPHRLRYLAQKLRAGRAVALEFHGEDFGHAFGFAA